MLLQGFAMTLMRLTMKLTCLETPNKELRLTIHETVRIANIGEGRKLLRHLELILYVGNVASVG